MVISEKVINFGAMHKKIVTFEQITGTVTITNTLNFEVEILFEVPVSSKYYFSMLRTERVLAAVIDLTVDTFDLTFLIFDFFFLKFRTQLQK